MEAQTDLGAEHKRRLPHKPPLFANHPRSFRFLLSVATVLCLIPMAARAAGTGRTKSTKALNLAVFQNDVEAVKRLIADGAPLTPRAGQERSIVGDPNPLDTAAEDNNLEMAKLLIAHGADVNYPRNLDGIAPTPLHTAALQGHVDMIKLLIASGADVNRQGKELWRTPLWHAIHSTITKDRLQSVTVLIDNGADVNIKRMGEVVKPMTVREKTADGQWKTVTETEGGCSTTPLHQAVFVLDTEVAELLIRKGADLSITDPAGLTPLQCAHQRLTVLRNPEVKPKVQAMIELLTKHTPAKP